MSLIFEDLIFKDSLWYFFFLLDGSRISSIRFIDLLVQLAGSFLLVVFVVQSCLASVFHSQYFFAFCLHCISYPSLSNLSSSSRLTF